MCDLKNPWGEEIPDILKRKLKKWVQDTSSDRIALTRTIPLKLKSVTVIDLHVFGDEYPRKLCSSLRNSLPAKYY